MENTNQITAFTLAEVLITLMVIGILAMVTIPGIMQAWEERVTVSKLKETYSTLQQAFKLAEIENGQPETWGFSYSNYSVTWDKMLPYLKTSQNCKLTAGGCAADGIKLLNEKPYININSDNTWYKFTLVSGVNIMSDRPSGQCTGSFYSDGQPSCFRLFVDINGLKGPNQFGKDVFAFSMTKRGFIPWGGYHTPGDYMYHQNSCTGPDNIGSSIEGLGCARWVIERGNMDYLHEVTTW
ncbi:MAG: prepilin-type N-terminal cleavage/methylation domain-containing protein [Candidatus Gastranaerophilales bacterium]|nr:prepilin-type N-terminal cleavage/methylation domain-containing protein [Candidatus Gastranaerophilales bacterium]